jgi:transposase
MTAKIKKKSPYNKLPVMVSRRDFNRFVAPYLSRPKKGPKAKLSRYQIFNHILSVLHTGSQWQQLRVGRNKLHWSNIYKWHNRWSKDGSYEKLFTQSILFLERAGKLDLSILHGDGTNTVAKKGAAESAIPDINSRKA